MKEIVERVCIRAANEHEGGTGCDTSQPRAAHQRCWESPPPPFNKKLKKETGIPPLLELRCLHARGVLTQETSSRWRGAVTREGGRESEGSLTESRRAALEVSYTLTATRRIASYPL